MVRGLPGVPPHRVAEGGHVGCRPPAEPVARCRRAPPERCHSVNCHRYFYLLLWSGRRHRSAQGLRHQRQADDHECHSEQENHPRSSGRDSEGFLEASTLPEVFRAPAGASAGCLGADRPEGGDPMGSRSEAGRPPDAGNAPEGVPPIGSDGVPQGPLRGRRAGGRIGALRAGLRGPAGAPPPSLDNWYTSAGGVKRPDPSLRLGSELLALERGGADTAIA